MTSEERTNLLNILETIQSNHSAPILLSIGSVSPSGIVEHDTIIIKDAPAIVTKELLSDGYNLSITPDGVRVSKF